MYSVVDEVGLAGAVRDYSEDCEVAGPLTAESDQAMLVGKLPA